VEILVGESVFLYLVWERHSSPLV